MIFGTAMVLANRIALIALLISLGVALSIYPGAIPIGAGPKVYPFQHMINGISGVILGPWYGAFIAFSIGILRVSIGTGTIHAFPGGIPGAIIVGLVYRYVLKKDVAALFEPIGTGLGAFISALIVAPLTGLTIKISFFGLTAQWQLFLISFLFSSIPGAIIGYLILIALRKRGILARISL
ncbi:MAG: energy coupling factor transporter S component ThiW [Nitrososphaerales archaeon]